MADKEKMENPYEKFGAHPCEVTAGRTAMWVFTILFVLGISLPPLIRNFQDAKKTTSNRWVPALEFWNHPNQKSKDALNKKRENSDRITRTEPSLRDHLQAVENEVKQADFRKEIARNDQALLTKVFNEGNVKTVIGREGWYFLQAGIDGLSGYGPLKSEPDAPTKDPDRAEWTPQLPVITKFAEQLEERGIELMIVPVPVKPMIHPEFLAKGAEAPVRHRDQLALYEKLREAGIEVVDLTDEMVKWKAESEAPLFLKQDTHWTHDTMERAAAAVAEKVKAKPYFSELEKNADIKTEVVTRQWIGDLINTLTDERPGDQYQPETQELVRILDSATGQPLDDDADSPIVLLGDSFVNVFDTPSIGFGKTKKDEDEIGAGFADTLAKELGIKLDTHTANGGGATAVRKAFAQSGADRIAKKKLVIWTLASRDLLLAETPGGKAEVRWKDVEFPKMSQQSNSSEGAIIVGTVKERSSLADPTSTPYADSIYSALLGDLQVESGTFTEDEAYVFLWGFKERKLLPTSQFQVGDEVRLEIIPISKAPGIKGINRADSVSAFSDPYFAVRATDASILWAEENDKSTESAAPETAEEAPPEDEGLPAKPLEFPLGFWIFVIGVFAYVIIGVTIQVRQRSATSAR